MQRFDGTYWQEYIRERVCPRFVQFGDIVVSRVLPAFHGINEEADELRQRRYSELMSGVNVSEADAWDAGEAMAELAFEEAMDHAVLQQSTRFATLNLYAAALYHLTEQHLIDLSLQILHYERRHNLRTDRAISWFRDILGLDVSTLGGWPLIRELRLVANVVKHAEGPSAQALREIRPDLFLYPTLRGHVPFLTRLRMRASLFGNDFFVTEEDFGRYHKGSIRFWSELADALPPLTR
jgi:hypothetical protein